MVKKCLLIFLFLFSNIADASQVLISVDGIAITSADLDNRINAIKLLSPDISNTKETRKQVLNSLVNEELFRNEAKRLKINISQNEVDEQFKVIKQEFAISETIYKTIINNKSLRKQIESQILWNRLVSLVLSHRIKVSDAEIREEQKVRKPIILSVGFKQIIFTNDQLNKIEEIKLIAKDCKNLDKILMQHSVSRAVFYQLAYAELNPELQSIVPSIPVNGFSKNLNFGNKQQLIMICNKEVTNETRNFQQIKQELSERKIHSEAQKYLQELHRRVYIDSFEQE